MLSLTQQKRAGSFNELTLVRRREIQTAALFKALTADMREDVRVHPWKYPAYAIYISAMVMPSPIVGHGLLMATVLVGWGKLGWTPGARALNSRLKDAFEPAALLRNHEEFVEYNEYPEHFSVRSTALAVVTLRQNLRDIGASTGYAFRSLGRIFPCK